MKTLFLFIKSMRPKQWTKNVIIFTGIVFAQNVFNIQMLTTVFFAFILFCLISGAIYTINDSIDVEKDRKHPLKSKRPIASGALGINKALIGAYIVIPVSLVLSYMLGLYFFLTIMAYFILQLAYSIILKHIVILDVFAIAFGFVLRVIAGAFVINVEISSWFIICTVLLSLFLGLSKRRHELESLEDEAHEHREVLNHYSPYLLDQMISVVTASTVISYILYTISTETVEKFGTKNLIFTVPFVLYGIFRYLYLIHQKGEGGNPENILVSDIPLLVNVVLWISTAILILYST